MSKVLEGATPVAKIAAQLLEDAKQGRRSYNVKFGSEISKASVSKRKTNLKAYVLSIVFCVVGIYHGLEYSKNKVTGFAVSGTGEILKNSTVVFHCVKNKKQYTCHSDEKGDFYIRLPSGKYRYWVKDHGSLETVRSTMSVSEECSGRRLTSFKK